MCYVLNLNPKDASDYTYQYFIKEYTIAVLPKKISVWCKKVTNSVKFQKRCEHAIGTSLA